MKTLIIAVVVILSGCSTSAYLTPGISMSNMTEAQRACKGHQGVHVVNSTITGFNAFCNDDSVVSL
jgi:hypothetical protein